VALAEETGDLLPGKQGTMKERGEETGVRGQESEIRIVEHPLS